MTIFLTNKSEELSTHIFWSQLGSSLILTNQSRDKPPPGRRFLCAPLVNCVRVDEFSVQFPAPLVWSRWEIWWEMVELFPLGCATWRCFLPFELTLWNAKVILWGGNFISLIHQRWNPGLDSYSEWRTNQSCLGSVKEEKHEGASLRPEDHTLRPLDVPTCCEVLMLILRWRGWADHEVSSPTMKDATSANRHNSPTHRQDRPSPVYKVIPFGQLVTSVVYR